MYLIGFLFTSFIATLVRNFVISNQAFRDDIIPNAWVISEWITLLGFASIGLEINVMQFFSPPADRHHHNANTNNRNNNLSEWKLFTTYWSIQSLDLCTTFMVAYFMLANTHLSNDDDDNNDNNNNLF